jgi:hypothetical protein
LHRNCLLKHVIEVKVGGIVVKGRRGGRRKQLQDDFKAKRGCLKLKEEALIALWTIRFGRDYGPLVR